MKSLLILLLLTGGAMADARSKYLGKQYGQVKVPVVKTKEKEVQDNFYGVFDTVSTQKEMRKKYKLNKISEQYKIK
tara:strand:- start:1672 stop:1899 length:228 start_codon:yes stop_codon:yes gene_type:complete